MTPDEMIKILSDAGYVVYKPVMDSTPTPLHGKYTIKPALETSSGDS